MGVYRVEVTETRVAVVYVKADSKASASAAAESFAPQLPAAEYTSMGYEALAIRTIEPDYEPSASEEKMTIVGDPKGRSIEEYLRSLE